MPGTEETVINQERMIEILQRLDANIGQLAQDLRWFRERMEHNERLMQSMRNLGR